MNLNGTDNDDIGGMNARDTLHEFEKLEVTEVRDLDLQIAHKNTIVNN